MGNQGVMESLAFYAGTSEPALRLLITVLLGYPAALIHRHFFFGQPPALQHVYLTISGFLLGYFNFGFDMLHTTANLLVVYAILKTIGGTVHSVIITLAFNMAYLLIGYLVTGTESYDIVWTMPQCILTLRLSGLAFDLYDGSKSEESLSKDSKKLALKEMPSLLEMAGYTYFPTCFLVGPQFPMRRYKDFVAGKLKDDPEKPLPNTVDAAIWRFTQGLIYLVLYFLGSMYYTEEFILGPQFSELSFLRRCITLGIWIHIILYKYVSCWLLCEGSCILIGLSYNGKDEKGNPKWDACANINIRLFETAQNFSHDSISSFNTNTNFWVLQYVYKRLRFLGNKYYSQLGVLLFLAVWHGFHSGYYMTFFMEFICVAMEKDLEVILVKNQTFLEWLSKPGIAEIKWIIMKFYTIVFMGPCVAPLQLLSFSRWWAVYKETYCFALVFWLFWPLYKPLVKALLPPKREHKD